MSEKVSGPYRGYFISISARLTPAPDGDGAGPSYVGAVSIARGPDDRRTFEALVELGDENRFATEEEALQLAERMARAHIDKLLDGV
ncbi:MAG: hypothetical protein ACRYG5_16790 [Janthinobacterium lividum]